MDTDSHVQKVTGKIKILAFTLSEIRQEQKILKWIVADIPELLCS
jgi:hypothetical protein